MGTFDELLCHPVFATQIQSEFRDGEKHNLWAELAWLDKAKRNERNVRDSCGGADIHDVGQRTSVLLVSPRDEQVVVMIEHFVSGGPHEPICQIPNYNRHD